MNFPTNSSVASASCGHISCFWCTFKAMDSFLESHCPVCRDTYNHFPRICGLMHFLLLKLYPLAYKRKAGQVAEEEKRCGKESPQFDDDLIEEFGMKLTTEQVTLHEDNASNQTTTSSQTTSNDPNSTAESTRKVLVTDLQCASCKQLLYRPIVLNCGHVHCESCIHPDDSIYRCSVCQSAHPKGIPNVCLILHHFLEECFPSEYSARKESLAHFKSHTPSGSMGQTPNGLANLLNSRSSFHPGAGCDYCGMYPIIGLRYRCKDCVEKIGFDLCENCHESSSKLPGRFNQQHTKDHQFEVIQASHLRMVLSSLGVGLSAEDDETGGSDNDGGIA